MFLLLQLLNESFEFLAPNNWLFFLGEKLHKEFADGFGVRGGP